MVLKFPNPNQKIASTIQIIGGIDKSKVITGFKKAAKLLKLPAISPKNIPKNVAVLTPTSDLQSVIFISLFL